MLKVSNSALLDPISNRLKETTSSVKCIPMLSVSINQIVKLFVPQIGLIVHKHLIGMVKLVGKVISKLSEDLYTLFKVTDGTYVNGLKVVSYRGSRVDPLTITIGKYFKFFGKIKLDTDGLPTLVAYTILPITDYNEISLHCCEIVRETLELKKLKNKISKVPNAHNASNVSTTTTTTNANTTVNTEVTFAPAPSCILGHQATQDVPPSTSETNEPTTENSKLPGDYLEGLPSEILNLLVKCEKPEGLSKQEIRDAFPTAPLAEVQEAMYFLDMEAHIYHTIDENHFKCVWD